MIRKKILEKIDVINVDNDKILAYMLREAVKLIIEPEVVEVDNGKFIEDILVLNIFIKEHEGPKIKYRMFLNRENEYITQEFTEGIEETKWRKSTLENLLADIWGFHPYVPMNKRILKENESIIKNYYDIDEDPLDYIYKIQNEMLKEKRLKRYEKITNEIDSEMSIVPEIPANFENWIEEEVFYNDKYIFYEYTHKKEKEGYCTYCKQHVDIIDVKHNKKGICPCCGSEITYKVIGKSRNILSDYIVVLPQRVNNTLIFRYFHVRKDFSFSKEVKYPHIVPKYVRELRRVFWNISSGEGCYYNYGEFKKTGEIRWLEKNNHLPYDGILAVIYTENIEEFIKDTDFKYSQIKEFATSKRNRKVDILGYFEVYQRNPVLEYLVKLKLYNIADNFYKYGKWGPEIKGKNFRQVIGLNKSYLPQLQRIDATYKMLDIIKLAVERNIKLSDEQILLIDHSFNKDIFKLTEYTTITKLINYFNKVVSSHKRKRDLSSIYIDYLDYIENCKKLQYDLNSSLVLFPRDFQKAHDDAYKLVTENAYKKYDEKLKALHQELKKYEFKYKDLCIVVPETAFDIVTEGDKLNHCVKGYIERMAAGETIILFIRKKDKIEEPYFTLELRDGEIRQVRGLRNCDMNKEVEQFIEKFKEAKLKIALKYVS